MDLSKTVFDVLDETKQTMNMTAAPKQNIIEMHISNLGFKMQEKGKKTCEVELKSKLKDPLAVMELAHYTMPLSTVFLVEGCLATVINSHFSNGN